jgi:arylsulfatase A-like enzyme
VDLCLKPLLSAFKDSTIVICADHGDCWGEDGLWEHGFHHQKVLEVPLIFKLNHS